MKYIFVLLFCLAGIEIQAQTAEDSIKVVVNKMFEAMKNADAAALKSCFADSAILQTVNNRQGKTTISTDALNEFADFVSKQKKGDADERIEFGTIKSDGQLAIVWAPYKFYFKDKFSHCGTDSFQLIRVNGEWKIQYLIDTRKKQGCDQ